MSAPWVRAPFAERNTVPYDPDIQPELDRLANNNAKLASDLRAVVLRLDALTELVNDIVTGPTDPPPPAWSPRFPLDVRPGTLRLGAAYSSTGSGAGGADPAAKYETPIGKPLPIRRRFWKWGDRSQLVAGVKSDAAKGRACWSSTKTPPWREVAAGQHDAALDALISGLRDTGVPTWLTLHHEPENDSSGIGTPAEWVSMQLHAEARRKALGADNVVIVPVLMSWTWDRRSGRNPDQWHTPGLPILGIDVYGQSVGAKPHESAGWKALRPWAKERGLTIAVGEVGTILTESNGAQAIAVWESWLDHCTDTGVIAACAFDSIYNNASTGFGYRIEGPLLGAFLGFLTRPEVVRL